MTVEASTTTSNVSPARTRFAASTPPTDSTLAPTPDSNSNCVASSASTCRVAIDEST
jgi:hypothetical protein